MGAPDLDPTAPSLEQVLVAACHDPRHLPWLYGSLLASTVHVTDYELVLGDHGPYLELAPGSDEVGPALCVYTSQAHVPRPHDAESMPFAAVLRGLPPGVAVVLNPAGRSCHRIEPATLDLLRRILAGA